MLNHSEYSEGCSMLTNRSGTDFTRQDSRQTLNIGQTSAEQDRPPVVPHKSNNVPQIFSLVKKIEYLLHPVSYTELPVEVLAPRVNLPVTGEKNRHVRPTVNLDTNIRAIYTSEHYYFQGGSKIPLTT